MTRAAILLPAMALLAACAGEPRSFADLRRSIEGLDADSQSAAIEQYVRQRGGTPFIENNSRVIFVARAVDGHTPRIVGDFNAWAATPQGYDATIGTPARLGQSEWSYLESTAFTNSRVEYTFLFEKEARPDPLNPRTVETFTGPRSEVRMPFWEAQPEIDEDPPAPAGQVIAETFSTRALGGTRRVWYYLPPGYEGSSDLYASVYVLDGGNYVEKMGVPRVLDRLIARKAIPPVIAVFSEPAERQEEYSRNPRWRQFVTGELVPAVDKRFRTFPAPDRRVILGSSLAGYGAVDLAIEFPNTFGLCAAIAPPVQAATVISNQAHGLRNSQSIRFFVLGGTYDTMIDGARRLRTALDEADAQVVYKEVPEGHSTETFKGRLDEALGALLTP